MVNHLGILKFLQVVVLSSLVFVYRSTIVQNAVGSIKYQIGSATLLKNWKQARACLVHGYPDS